MPRSTDGGYSLPIGSLVNTGDTILPSQHNPALNDIAQALTNSVDRDGRGGMRAPLDMGGQPIRNIGSGVNPGDAATVAQAASGGVPIGSVLDYAGGTAPATYLLCFGQTVSRTDFALLFAAIGTSYGAGDGSLTFNVPDFRGRVGAGKDDMGGTPASRLTGTAGGVNGAALGQVGGAQTHVLTVAELAAHAHLLDGVTGFANNGGGPAGATDVGSSSSNVTQPNGSNSPHNNVQPTIIMNKIIKASAS